MQAGEKHLLKLSLWCAEQEQHKEMQLCTNTEVTTDRLMFLFHPDHLHLAPLSSRDSLPN